MALLCYNKGCGQKFDANKNKDDSCLFHPGIPIFHDALKGWSCCKKRTTDFSEFLSIQGCTHGRHSNDKPHEPLRPEVTSNKAETKSGGNGAEIIYQGPKSAETLQKERPSGDEPLMKLPQKVSASLVQVLQKLDISNAAEQEKADSRTVATGTRCKNSGCKTVYQGPETDAEVCTHHPGVPIFHEGYKYWSCCCIQTSDFNAFLDQKGCGSGRHRWVPRQDKKKVACRHDWHQTGSDVVVTIYAKNANPELSSVQANRTVLSCQIHFENNKLFKRDFHLWGVVDTKCSSVNMVPSKVEVTLKKADRVSWGKLEDPNYKPEPEPADETMTTTEPAPPAWDIEDDDISDSDEDWAYDTEENQELLAKKKEEKKKKAEEEVQMKRKEVEEDMKRAMEERRRAEEEKKKLEEQRRQEEGQEGFEDMPDLEDHDEDQD